MLFDKPECWYRCLVKKRIMKYLSILVAALSVLSACNKTDLNESNLSSKATQVVNKVGPFSDYWEKGTAEITTYDLKQARYGEIHEGISNTIFVTEPFSKSKQVKLDNPNGNPSDNIHVLKLNFTRKFYTGVYPYSTMLSVFTPTNQNKHPKSLKAVFGAQEWCGQTFTQMNLDGNGYQMEEFSYFESEGDKRTKIGGAVLEDELWNKLRIDPNSLPTGEFDAVPGLTFTRLAHQPAQAVPANATMKQNGNTSTYSINYPAYKRTLSIEFNSKFPHEIVSWSESGYSGFGPNRKELTTTATVKSRKMIDYWNKHDQKDAALRAELGLE